MVAIPQEVRQAWEEREGPIVLGTVSPEGIPNIIYAGAVSLHGDDRVVIADNYFDKTRRNLLDNRRGAVLFINKDKKAYQLKGTLEYHTEGEIFQDMKSWNPKEHPGHAAAVLRVEEIFCGAERIR